MAKVKNKKSKMSETFAKKRKQQLVKKALSPFEIHVNRSKQKILGQKSKSDRGLPGVARTKAIAKRKKSLLQEYRAKDKDNVFLDKRMYQKNSHMSEEDKALARFAKEKMKKFDKRSIFNLNGNDNDDILTHKGQSIIDIEKFDNPNSDLDDELSGDEDQSGRLSKKFLEEAHFGGGLLSKVDPNSSKKDVIAELIAESKKRKAERQKLREETLDLTGKLDTEWRDLLPIINTSNKNAERSAECKQQVDDYDKMVKELKFDVRGHATDKLKTDKQVAEENRTKLEELERERLKRMNDDSRKSRAFTNHRSADDLDDGYEQVNVNAEEGEEKDNESAEGGSGTDSEDDRDEEDVENMADELEAENKEGDQQEENRERVEQRRRGKRNEEKENEQEGGSEKLSDDQNRRPDDEEEFRIDVEFEDEDNLSDLKYSESSSSEDEAPVEKTVLRKIQTNIINKLKENESLDESIKKKNESLKKARAELPESFEVPETYGDLKELLGEYDADFQSIIVERIIKSNHWSLGVANNKQKLLGLFEHLLMYIDCFDTSNAESIVEKFRVLDRLCPYLYDLAHASAEHARKCFKDIIKAKHVQFTENPKKHVGINSLMFMKLLSLLFPTSDFRHPIVTPCLVFMSQILLRCPVKKKSHISKGLYISTLILEYTTFSKRFAPSVINYLRGLIYLALPASSKDVTVKVIPPFKREGRFSDLLVISENEFGLRIENEKLQMRASDLLDDEIDADFKLRVFATTINLIQEFKEQYEQLEACYSIFEPILKMLKCDFISRYPKCLKEKVNKLVGELEEMKIKKLKYLVRPQKKPKALRLYEPLIEPVYEGKKYRKMSEAKAETSKLLHKLKREKKGAIREVRKDTAFLAKLKIKEEIKNDLERKRKVKEIFGDAAVQQGELNKLKRQKR